MTQIDDEQNVVLIGMPGVGKSTVGVVLAKLLNRDFIDTDVVIQSRENRSLQQIMREEGRDRFCELEERYVLSLQCRRAVIATGGSVVYSDVAMEHLAEDGVIVHLDAPLSLVQKRVKDVGERGVAMMPGQTLEDLYAERQSLYRRWARISVSTEGRDHEEVLHQILIRLDDAEEGG